jgi:hypothetical protein
LREKNGHTIYTAILRTRLVVRAHALTKRKELLRTCNTNNIADAEADNDDATCLLPLLLRLYRNICVCAATIDRKKGSYLFSAAQQMLIF